MKGEGLCEHRWQRNKNWKDKSGRKSSRLSAYSLGSFLETSAHTTHSNYISISTYALFFFSNFFFFLLHLIHPSICLYTFSRTRNFSYRTYTYTPPPSPQFSCARRHGMRVERDEFSVDSWRLVYRVVGR